MQIVRRLPSLKRAIARVKRQGKRIGFVPTMGAFHEGHLSLIRQARQENDFVVVSIFVNPLQFDRAADLLSYPRTLRKDVQAAKGAGCDLLFIPTAKEMYPPDFETAVTVEKLSRIFEGRSRPGHFRGVATVVTKLFNLVSPNVAYFGQKDAQQARIIEQLIQDLHFDIRLRILPTVRENDGLAISSRNCLLPSRARRSSGVLFRALQEGRRLIECGERRGSIVERQMRCRLKGVPGLTVDYVALVNPKTFTREHRVGPSTMGLVAVWINRVRLIDCMQLS